VGIILLGYYSKNKYAFIGSIRAASMVIAIELLYGVLVLFIVFLTGSFNTASLFMYQEEFPLLFLFAPLLPFLLLFLMLEVNKSPFDLSEAETELVTGYHTEYGSFLFGLYYLGEYIHIFFGSHFLVLLLGAV
jgi:NADH:ubiquinone oxidoreductase subunit H